eukprot:g62098.t1
MLCYAMLCYGMARLCYAMLCYAVLCLTTLTSGKAGEKMADLAAAETGGVADGKQGFDFPGRKALFTETMSHYVRQAKKEDGANTEKPQFWTLTAKKKEELVRAVAKKTLFDPQPRESKGADASTKVEVFWQVVQDLLLGGYTVTCEEKKVEQTKEKQTTTTTVHTAYINSYGVLESCSSTSSTSTSSCLIM